ncbi:DUF6881 domain-containing protein [Nocardia beijingensis]|uniref:DUF6881 domain-containing protein n=1 Tax=Nocardia beijingensis TaxID=95162 RepID=A0ABW7WP00_9NOCA|nr:hypothetical protein [Nocardia beijingensis]MBF6077144.1 hypothetical protein [Nocardia beijingensis]
MWYLKAQWHHDFDDEPVELFSEIGDDGFEVRKVEVFRDGHRDWADSSSGTGTTELGQIPVPTPDELSAETEFTALQIDAEEFDEVWRHALDEQRPTSPR